jgi:hypothetical protein
MGETYRKDLQYLSVLPKKLIAGYDRFHSECQRVQKH